MKKKLSEEVRHLQKEVVGLEKQLVGKNNTIYSLEMTAIKRRQPQGYQPQPHPQPR